jgi:hypothetical protein
LSRGERERWIRIALCESLLWWAYFNLLKRDTGCIAALLSTEIDCDCALVVGLELEVDVVERLDLSLLYFVVFKCTRLVF